MCPVCRQIANSVLPIVPPTGTIVNQHHDTIINTNTINKLTELIEQVSAKSTSSSHNAYGNSGWRVSIYNDT